MAKKNTESLIRIVKAGGNIEIEADKKSTDDLVRIAKAASGANVNVTFSKVGDKSTDSLVRIAKEAKGWVCLKDI